MDKTNFMKRIFKDVEYALTSDYGMRIHPITGENKMHWGEDYRPKGGVKCPLYSPVYGVVSQVGSNAVRGKFVEIKVAIGYVFFQHLDSYAVRVGQKVAPSTKIGVCGTTGLSTGVHLHLEMRNLRHEAINPDSAIAIPAYKDPGTIRYVDNAKGLNVRKSPSLSGEVAYVLDDNAAVRVFSYVTDAKDPTKKWAVVSYTLPRYCAEWLLN